MSFTTFVLGPLRTDEVQGRKPKGQRVPSLVDFFNLVTLPPFYKRKSLEIFQIQILDGREGYDPA